jgi:hypothetical protein
MRTGVESFSAVLKRNKAAKAAEAAAYLLKI